jgi:hypothetical protein
MNDAFDIIVFLENGESVIEIAEVNLIVFYWCSGNFFDAFQNVGIAPGIIVNAYYFVAVFKKVNQRMRANKAAATRNQYFRHGLKN